MPDLDQQGVTQIGNERERRLGTATATNSLDRGSRFTPPYKTLGTPPAAAGAVALDVYFHDVASKVTVDLTHVCTDIPSCTSSENDSSAFGGASSQTVSQLLAYAAINAQGEESP